MKSNEICNDIKSCSGCEACANICAHDAITMKPDWRGFLYPYIDVEKCVDCKLCQKICPVNLQFVCSSPQKDYEKNILF